MNKNGQLVSFQPQGSNTSIEGALTGDISSDSMPDAAVLPEFGGIEDAGELTGDTMYRLEAPIGSPSFEYGDLGSDGEIGAMVGLQRTGRPVNMQIARGAGEFQAGGPRPPASKIGVVQSRAALEQAGVFGKGQQDGVLRSALMSANLNALGRKAAGLLNMGDNVPFISLQRGNIVSIRTLRPNAGFKAQHLRHLISRQMELLPYQTLITSATPAIGGTVEINVSPSVAIDTDYPIFMLMVLVGTSVITRNDAKVLTLTLRSGTGAGLTYTKTYFEVDVRYDDTANVALVAIPALESDGNFYPTVLTARRDTVPANNRNVGITITNNDGVNDVVTVIALGTNSNYIQNLMARLT